MLPTTVSSSTLCLPRNECYFTYLLFSAVNEFTQGALQSFTTTPDGIVTGPLDTVTSGGDSPAFALALSTGEVAVMNYNGGNGRIIPTTCEDPLKFDNASAPAITFPAPTNPVDPNRQDGSHPHQAVEHGEEVLVPDLVRRGFLTCRYVV